MYEGGGPRHPSPKLRDFIHPRVFFFGSLIPFRQLGFYESSFGQVERFFLQMQKSWYNFVENNDFFFLVRDWSVFRCRKMEAQKLDLCDLSQSRVYKKKIYYT